MNLPNAQEVTPNLQKPMYPDFDPTHVDLREYRAIGKQLTATLPSSMLPINSEAEKASYRIQFAPDPDLEAQVDRRIKQGRAAVFSTCCRVLNPLESLPCEGKTTRSTYKATELLLRSGEATRLHVMSRLSYNGTLPIVLLIGVAENDSGFDVVFNRMSVSTNKITLSNCTDPRLRGLCMRDGGAPNADLCFAEGSCQNQDQQAHARTALAQLVIALSRIREGGTLIMKLMTLDGAMVTGLIYTIVRHYFLGPVTFCKPTSSRPANAEVYIIALNMAPLVHREERKAPSVASLSVWLDRSTLERSSAGKGEVLILQQDASEPPFQVNAEMTSCVDYFRRRYMLRRQAICRRALSLCRVIIEHRPITRSVQLKNLLTACTENIALRNLARKYQEQWPMSAIWNQEHQAEAKRPE
jgi:hypothetical protein